MNKATMPAAVACAAGVPEPALLWLALSAAAYVARDPGRLLEVIFIGAFLGIGYLAG